MSSTIYAFADIQRIHSLAIVTANDAIDLRRLPGMAYRNAHYMMSVCACVYVCEKQHNALARIGSDDAHNYWQRPGTSPWPS